ncbi:AraC family transcriptional regulator [Amycolatopsis sp. FDAARGOS 1241]|uniref:helix-turn-helix transcriptional regulator n=1 Tax=Amycolatopsis sp. FDAARGOS 1241 TaxID=2778070 RepID=UPI0019517EE4|nr:AraC family transcriptional regulator [Amycolatopsis sp. FDAARGOS 1241]QRP47091.1 helix-turn-helix transcriptional regulator [Amycolatopsis sp. FDAARGOS 1241]
MEPYPYRTFTTCGLREARRFALWEQHNEETLVRLACRTLTQGSFEGWETSLLVGEFKIANITATAHVVERDRRLIRRNESGRVALYFTLFGEAFFYHDKGIRLQQPGTLLVCDLDHPFLRGFAQGLREYVLMVPKPTFEELTASAAPLTPTTRRFSLTDTTGSPAADLARLLRDLLAAPPLAGPGTEARIRALLTELAEGERHPLAAQHRRRVLAHIDAHLGDRGLTTSSVASAVGLSNRQLTRVFSQGGVGRVIRERRLRSAYERLTTDPAAPISRVAHACGFASHAHFTRAFREHYGVPPSAIRSA